MQGGVKHEPSGACCRGTLGMQSEIEGWRLCGAHMQRERERASEREREAGYFVTKVTGQQIVIFCPLTPSDQCAPGSLWTKRHGRPTG